MPLVGDISGSAGKASRIGITGSVVFAGADPDYAVTFPSVGTDVAFYVSGSIGAGSGDQTTSVFGGDTVVSGNLSVGTGSSGIQSLNVYADVSGDYAAKIDNDNASSGHVLKLLTDGNGSASRLLEMEDGDGDILFRARADGRFGFGATGVSSMGAGTFVVGIDGSHTADIAISKRLQHLGDSDTYMDFTAADQIEFVAGGVDMIHITEDGSQDMIVFNEGGADVDFRVESSGEDEAIFLNAGTDELHINKGASAFSTIIYGNHGNALEVNSSGVVINEGSFAGNDFRVESNNKTHALFVDAGTDQVLILSGGGITSPSETGYTDTAFFVSGTIGSRGSASVKGTAVFGGDVHISGTVTAGGGISGAVSAVANGADNRVATFSSSDALAGESNLTFDGSTLTVTGDTSLNGGVIINEGSADKDFRVESNGNTHMLFVNGGTNRLSIGTAGASPDTTVHMRDDTPTLRIQRDDNANNSTIEWAGAAGVRANMFHLGTSNDLIISSWNGSAVEESLRFVPITRQIIFNSGSSNGPGSQNEATGSDVSFYVSGAQYSQGTSTRGVAVFGGDVYASGTMLGKQYYIHQGTYQKGSEVPVFLGLYNNNESTSVIDDVTMVAPFNGRCVRIIARSDTSGGLGVAVAGFHKATDGTEFPSTTAAESVTNSNDAQHTPLTFDFSLSGSQAPATAFSAGDVLAFSINPTNTHGEVNFCIVLEYTLTRIISGSTV